MFSSGFRRDSGSFLYFGNVYNHRVAAGGGFLSGAVDKLLVGRRLRELTPKQLGDEDTIDTDVRDEMDRVAIGGADEDVVKVWTLSRQRCHVSCHADEVHNMNQKREHVLNLFFVPLLLHPIESPVFALDFTSLQIASLRKVYPLSKGAKVAVKSTSLGIPRGECFGLLGINGAGKSSTLAILSGQFLSLPAIIALFAVV